MDIETLCSKCSTYMIFIFCRFCKTNNLCAECSYCKQCNTNLLPSCSSLNCTRNAVITCHRCNIRYCNECENFDCCRECENGGGVCEDCKFCIHCNKENSSVCEICENGKASIVCNQCEINICEICDLSCINCDYPGCKYCLDGENICESCRYGYD